MKNYLMCLVLLGLVLTTYSQEPTAYNVELQYVHELDNDNKVYSEKKPEMSITINSDEMVTKTQSEVFSDRIVDVKRTDSGVEYTLENPSLGLIWVTIEDDIMKMKLEADSKMLYVYKITG